MMFHRPRVIIHFDDDGDVRDDDDNAWADPWSGKLKALSPSLAHPARTSIDLVTIGNPNDTLGASATSGGGTVPPFLWEWFLLV